MQIYIAEGTQRTGPFDLDTIRSGLSTGKYAPTQLAWYEGAPGWEPISKLPGLETAFAPPPPAPPPYPSAPPAPYNLPPTYQAPSYPTTPPAAPKRRSVWWKVAGFALGVAALVDGIVTFNKGLNEIHPTVSADASSATPSGTTRHFVTDRSRCSGALAAHYVAFSFDYPEAWTIRDHAPDAYIELRHMTRLSNGKDVPVETIIFSYGYSINPDYPLGTNLELVGPAILEQAAAMLTKEVPGCTITPAKGGRFGKYQSEERLGTAHDKDDNAGNYFKMVVVPQQNGSADGLYISLWGNGASGAKSAETLGDTGGLRTIRDSLRFEP